MRRGEHCYAIGAACSHYGGPLAEGFVETDGRLLALASVFRDCESLEAEAAMEHELARSRPGLPAS